MQKPAQKPTKTSPLSRRSFSIAIMGADGRIARQEVTEMRTFRTIIDGEPFWFAVHRDAADSRRLVLSHMESGRQVCPVSFFGGTTMAWTVRGRLALNALVAHTGAVKFVAALRRAERAAATS